MSAFKGATRAITSSIREGETSRDFSAATRWLATRSKWTGWMARRSCAAFMSLPRYFGRPARRLGDELRQRIGGATRSFVRSKKGLSSGSSSTRS